MLPNFLLYYWAAVLVTVRWWFSQPRQNPAVRLEAAILGSYAALSNFVFRGVKALYSLTVPMRIRVWQDARAVFYKPNCLSPHTPLLGNPRLPHLNSIPDPFLWATWGIITMKHIIQDGRLMPFPELQRLYSLPGAWEFKYWQLRYAMGAQFTGC